MRNGAILIVDEDRVVEIEKSLHDLANGGLVNVWNQFFNNVLVLKDVLEHFSGVAADQYFKEIAPVAAKNRIKLGPVGVEETEESLEKFIFITVGGWNRHHGLNPQVFARSAAI